MTTYNVQEVEKVVANRLKAPKGFFKWAETQFPIYTWSNKSRTIVSSERKEYSHKVKTKLLSTNSRLTFYSETKYFVWVGVTTKRIEMQMYAITQNIVDGKEKFSSVLYNFYQLANNKMIKAGLAGYSDYKPIYSNKFVAQGGMCGAFYNYYLYEDIHAFTIFED